MGNSIAQTMVDGGIYQVLHSPSFGNDPAGQLAVARRSEERLPGTKVKVIRAGKVQGLEVVRTGSMGRGSLKHLFVVNNTIYSLEATYGEPNPAPRPALLSIPSPFPAEYPHPREISRPEWTARIKPP